jgi:hypothetical protein
MKLSAIAEEIRCVCPVCGSNVKGKILGMCDHKRVSAPPALGQVVHQDSPWRECVFVDDSFGSGLKFGTAE